MTPPTPLDRTGRRRRRSGLVGLVVAVVALLATACGGATSEAPASPAASEPRTITHIFGSTQVPANPQRVVSVGYTDVDYLLALGIKPVAYNDWFSTKPDSFYLPWQTEPAAGATAPQIPVYDGLQIDKVAAATPDLIVATNAIDKAQYDLLSKIAPTVGPLREGEEVAPWPDLTRYIASIFGREADGEKLVTDLEAKIAATRTEHPEFAGKTLTFASGGQDLFPYLPTDGRNVLFQQLGFTLSQGVLESSKYTTDTTGFSPENVHLLDADVFVAQAYVPEDRTTTEANPAFQNLDVVKRGDVIWPDEDTLNAITFGSVLSIPYAVDRLVPELSAATKN